MGSLLMLPNIFSYIPLLKNLLLIDWQAQRQSEFTELSTGYFTLVLCIQNASLVWWRNAKAHSMCAVLPLLSRLAMTVQVASGSGKTLLCCLICIFMCTNSHMHIICKRIEKAVRKDCVGPVLLLIASVNVRTSKAFMQMTFLSSSM